MNENNELLTVAGKTPDEFSKAKLGGDIWVTGMSPSDVFDLYGEAQFDYSMLKIEFKRICSDFGNTLSWNTASRSLHFASIVLFKIGPESRRVTITKGNKIWKFRFVEANPTGQGHKINTVMVINYKTVSPPNTQPKVKNNVLWLTIKQASLLATDILSTMMLPAISNKCLIITPIAKAIFCKDDLDNLMDDLRIEKSDVNKASLVISINSSCQSDGHYLDYSKCHIAACAALSATINIKDRKIAFDIVKKTIKQYTSRGKVFESDKFDIFCRYAAGGILKNMDQK